MLYVITSNDVPIRSVHDYTGGYELSLLHQFSSPVMPGKMISSYDLFMQDETSLEDGLDSSHLIDIEVHESPSIFSSLEEISELLRAAELSEEEKDEDIRSEIRVVCACKYQWNKEITRQLGSYLGDRDSEIIPINLFTEFHIPSMDRLANTLKTTLNTTFIYPDDPISFGYALYQALGGLL